MIAVTVNHSKMGRKKKKVKKYPSKHHSFLWLKALSMDLIHLHFWGSIWRTEHPAPFWESDHFENHGLISSLLGCSSEKRLASTGAKDREVNIIRDIPRDKPPKIKTKEILS